MIKRQWKVKEFCKVLSDEGYSPIRRKGSHETWGNGQKNITIPISKTEINPMIARRLLKEIS